MRELAWTLALASTLAGAQPSPCTLVFGQGRNPTEIGDADRRWDEANARFNTAVVARLEASGRRVFALLASTDEIDPARQAADLLGLARERGCFTVVETTVFADLETNADAATLIARLRVYPVLPALGAEDAVAGLRFGAPLFSSQRESSWSPQALARFRAEAVAGQLALDYLRRP
jgi:hypothetical protein